MLLQVCLGIIRTNLKHKRQAYLVCLKFNKKLYATFVRVKLLNGSVLKTKTSVSAVIGASKENSDQITNIKFNDFSLELN